MEQQFASEVGTKGVNKTGLRRAVILSEGGLTENPRRGKNQDSKANRRTSTKNRARKQAERAENEAILAEQESALQDYVDHEYTTEELDAMAREAAEDYKVYNKQHFKRRKKPIVEIVAYDTDIELQ